MDVMCISNLIENKLYVIDKLMQMKVPGTPYFLMATED